MKIMELVLYCIIIIIINNNNNNNNNNNKSTINSSPLKSRLFSRKELNNIELFSRHLDN